MTTTDSGGSTSESIDGVICNVAVEDPEAKVICGSTAILATKISLPCPLTNVWPFIDESVYPPTITAPSMPTVKPQPSSLPTELNNLVQTLVPSARYLLTNTDELLVRLNILLTKLEGCQAVKDSDVLKELYQTRDSLVALQEQLATYIIQYDSKVDPNTAMFGGYDIRVVDEELTDRSIQNKRRRGIALNRDGQIVAQSDLTFATNTAVIIAEVQQKLVAGGLVQPSLGVIDGVDLATISDSLNYLDSNDVLNDNLSIQPTELDAPDNLDENQGLGINAFFNNLPGGKKLRQRTAKAVAASIANVKSQVAGEVSTSKQTLGIK